MDSESASASIHKNTAVIASVYSESDPIAKYNAVLCVLAPDDPSTDVDSDRIAVRRINTIAQDESGILKYYPTTMQLTPWEPNRRSPWTTFWANVLTRARSCTPM